MPEAAEIVPIRPLEDVPDVADGPFPERPRRVTMFRVVVAALAVFVGFLALGNLAILGAHALARHSAGSPPSIDVQGIEKFRVIDGKLWRGAAPNRDGYASLAAHGARTVVDLRAEADVRVDREMLDDLGLDLVRIPIRDGQTPTTDEVERFMAAVRASDGPVFVHCGAGVGRTGAFAAAWTIAVGEADGLEAVRSNLAVGPPSLEQIAYAARFDPRDPDRPSPVVVAVSRLLDSPRRTWHVLGL
jgi:protein-tyrosine phosphatase